jgi:hypothetical protein
MRILTQSDGGIKGYHGDVGSRTNMVDSFGNELFIGDIVVTSNQDEFAKKNGYLGEEYGIHFVCEENITIADWTGQDHQYVMGIASIWDSSKFNDINDLDDEKFNDFLWNKMDGWIVHKVKDYKDLVAGEKLEFLYVQDIE